MRGLLSVAASARLVSVRISSFGGGGISAITVFMKLSAPMQSAIGTVRQISTCAARHRLARRRSRTHRTRCPGARGRAAASPGVLMPNAPESETNSPPRSGPKLRVNGDVPAAAPEPVRSTRPSPSTTSSPSSRSLTNPRPTPQEFCDSVPPTVAYRPESVPPKTSVIPVPSSASASWAQVTPDLDGDVPVVGVELDDPVHATRVDDDRVGTSRRVGERVRHAAATRDDREPRGVRDAHCLDDLGGGRRPSDGDGQRDLGVGEVGREPARARPRRSGRGRHRGRREVVERARGAVSRQRGGHSTSQVARSAGSGQGRGRWSPRVGAAERRQQRGERRMMLSNNQDGPFGRSGGRSGEPVDQSRATWLSAIDAHRHSLERPDDDRYWCRRLDTASRDELRDPGGQARTGGAVRVRVHPPLPAQARCPRHRPGRRPVGRRPRRPADHDQARHGCRSRGAPAMGHLHRRRRRHLARARMAGLRHVRHDGRHRAPSGTRRSTARCGHGRTRARCTRWASERERDVALLAFGYGPHVWLWGVHYALNLMGIPILTGGGLDSRMRRAVHRPVPADDPRVHPVVRDVPRLRHDRSSASILRRPRSAPSSAPASPASRCRRRAPCSRRRWDAELHEFYGCTEAAPAAGGYTCERGRRREGRARQHPPHGGPPDLGDRRSRDAASPSRPASEASRS